jgi:hypothetical protein
MLPKFSAFIAAAAVVILGQTAIATAQPADRGWGPSMMGPGMIGPGMHMRMCGPRAAGFAEWRIARLEQVIKPTEAQKPKFDELKAASNKAVEAMRAACPTSISTTAVDQVGAMEKRLEAMLAAVKIMRPAMEGFYATLSDEQKKVLDSGIGTGRFWRWRDRWW